MSNVSIPKWALELFKPYRYKVAYGGRASGKSWAYAISLVIQAAREPKKIGVAREVQKSMEYSSQDLLWGQTKRMRIMGYTRTRTGIRHKNGSEFQFRGLGKAQEESLKGWENVDIVWIDEAHMMSASSWEILKNTIRKPGSELWLTFNPKNRHDPVFEEFVLNTPDDMFRKKVLYTDNPFFTRESENERKRDLKNKPARYPHIWLGETDDHSEDQLVLPFNLVTTSRNLWNRDLGGSYYHAGFDVAHTGSDSCALAIRSGPVLVHLETWNAETISDSVWKVHRTLENYGVTRMYYDVGGIGVAVDEVLRNIGPNKSYLPVQVNFGGSVTKPKRKYAKRLSNKEFFSNRAAQLGWNLRTRAEKTQQLHTDKNMKPEDCLFIAPGVPEELLYQMSQPTWVDEPKLKINKKGTGSKSPDAYDAVILSFARDTE